MENRFIAVVPMVLACAVSAAQSVDTGWSAYGGDSGGSRYSALTQITPENVAELEVAWVFRTGELGQGVKDWRRSAFEATPILYEGTLYLTTSATDVVAVDAATGTLRWRHASESRKDLHYSDGVSRGVSLWVDPDNGPDATCHARIFAPTLDGRLLALDAANGNPCADFGEHGAVNLLRDVRSQFEEGDEWRDYLVTSPPAILDDKVIVGSSVGDNRAVLEELGIVRAFDARSGALVWSWDPIPRDASNPVYAEWDPQGVAKASAANAWAPLSVDPQRHLVFVPTGSASPDFYGGERPGDNRWANSIVALDGETGSLKWGRQLVHHDLWDYDLASQPTLADIDHDGRRVAAVIQATKTGFLYTFDRDSGEPLFPIVERAVPQDAVPGEQPSPTQPFPVAPPGLVRQGPVTVDDAWGLGLFDWLSCRKRIKAMRSEGMFQPPAIKDSIMQPGNAGGSNWGGIAFDPQRQIAVANTMDLPFVVALIPRDELKAQAESGRYDDFDFSRQAGTPYGMRRQTFKSALGIPCVKPPWGTLSGVDMATGTIKWRIPLGLTPVVPMNLGMPNLGGPIVTASGLVFIAASFDDHLRAFATDTGKLLWDVKLPAGGQATPMTYAVGGRQYLVIAAGGYKGDSTRGDYLVAYALPH
ncbi:pyrroloquinoline quinone-dependent dehydrogenase [Dokdonella immobilis]|uniref:Quinoprotein glucose dehydrogenase n=1 Tax=Dokdonella immobilis TaxID=578942 RepID=A0A1I5B7P6_9GAMM|nr:pyrroloquinoline quinone-dependent dehydrogenase [Dokdonella immobilis]SFN70650.1 quinoprotein glucose dehydrogenase [Dokdonella immobilis]